MAESLENGLGKKIEKESKGYKLLSKMGFEEGKGVGKQKQGIVEPVGVKIKEGKEGIGKSVKTEKAEILKKYFKGDVDRF